MTEYLSYGAGVGSTALLCHMLDNIKNGNVEFVFCDHGANWLVGLVVLIIFAIIMGLILRLGLSEFDEI